MTEQELRALVREAISRHVAGTGGAPVTSRSLTQLQHSSHALFLVPDGSDSDGPCFIEPTVMCTHCGYCKSYVH